MNLRTGQLGEVVSAQLLSDFGSLVGVMDFLDHEYLYTEFATNLGPKLNEMEVISWAAKT